MQFDLNFNFLLLFFSSIRLITKKETVNKGRPFYTCPNSCGFFEWADQQQPSSTSSNNWNNRTVTATSSCKYYIFLVFASIHNLFYNQIFLQPITPTTILRVEIMPRVHQEHQIKNEKIVLARQQAMHRLVNEQKENAAFVNKKVIQNQIVPNLKGWTEVDL